MARRADVRPTPAELAILAVLWERGPSTVREVHEALGGDGRTGYTTTLKLMQIMVGKGLLRRDESSRSHVYRPARNRERTQRRLVKDMVERAFAGSAARLILHALSAGHISGQEIEEIRKLLDEHRR
jgi:predicted transcriptional regulator